MSRPPEIVVTGRGVVSSLGESADTLYEALLAKRSGIVDGGGACVGFDPESVMAPKEGRRTHRFTQRGVAAAAQAAAEAGVPAAVEPERLGVIMGTVIGGMTPLGR